MKIFLNFTLLVVSCLVYVNCTGASIHSSYAPSVNAHPAREYATATPLSKGGFFFHKAYTPGQLGLGTEAKEEGRGCNHSVIGLISFGDSSIDTAKKAGNISKIAYIDYESVGILTGWVYHRFCTIVKGS